MRLNIFLISVKTNLYHFHTDALKQKSKFEFLFTDTVPGTLFIVFNGYDHKNVAIV